MTVPDHELDLHVDPDAAEPPYEQVREQIRARVDAGDLAPGTQLPTVRRLAADLGLAANTVARAYRELEALGLIETRGRAGSVVTGGGVERAARQAAHGVRRRVRALGLADDRGRRAGPPRPALSGAHHARRPGREGGRGVRGASGAQPLRLVISSVAAGRTVCRSPTTPKSTSSKIGASSSLLTATIVFEVCMPARCWIAPEMPLAT